MRNIYQYWSFVNTPVFNSIITKGGKLEMSHNFPQALKQKQLPLSQYEIIRHKVIVNVKDDEYITQVLVAKNYFSICSLKNK